RLAACAMGNETLAPEVVQQRFGEDGAGGVAGAEKEYVVRVVHGGPKESRGNGLACRWLAAGRCECVCHFAGGALTAVFGEVPEQGIHALVIRDVIDEATVLPRCNESGMRKLLQMKGERCVRDAESFGQNTGG